MIHKWNVLECSGIVVVYEGERWPHAGCHGDEPEVRAVWYGAYVNGAFFPNGPVIRGRFVLDPADVAAAHALADSHNSMIGMPIKPV